MEETGSLAVRVSTAGGAIPVEGAIVYVRSLGDDSRLLFSLRTDESGGTATVSLPAAVPPEYGETPGPCDAYGAEIKKDGYRTIEYTCVPVYPGITSVIEAELEPVTEDDAEAGIPPRAELISPPLYPDLFGSGRG